MSTETLERLDTSTGNHDRFWHIFDTIEFPGDRVGRLTRALCGKEWRLEGYGDGGYPLCPTCDEIAGGVR